MRIDQIKLRNALRTKYKSPANFLKEALGLDEASLNEGGEGYGNTHAGFLDFLKDKVDAETLSAINLKLSDLIHNVKIQARGSAPAEDDEPDEPATGLEALRQKLRACGLSDTDIAEAERIAFGEGEDAVSESPQQKLADVTATKHAAAMDSAKFLSGLPRNLNPGPARTPARAAARAAAARADTALAMDSEALARFAERYPGAASIKIL
jgi:hypothetical protein